MVYWLFSFVFLFVRLFFPETWKRPKNCHPLETAEEVSDGAGDNTPLDPMGSNVWHGEEEIG
jgi:hypothetical protein